MAGDISFYYFSLEKIPYRLNFSIKVAEKNRLDLATYGGQVGSVLMTTFDTNLLFYFILRISHSSIARLSSTLLYFFKSSKGCKDFLVNRCIRHKYRSDMHCQSLRSMNKTCKPASFSVARKGGVDCGGQRVLNDL